MLRSVTRGEIEDAVDKLLQRVAMLFKDLRAARDLLAVIHCDGGQHTERFGFEKSCRDAEQKYRFLKLVQEATGTRVNEAIIHAPDCWRERGHHGCAIERIKAMKPSVRELEALYKLTRTYGLVVGACRNSRYAHEFWAGRIGEHGWDITAPTLSELLDAYLDVEDQVKDIEDAQNTEDTQAT